ncbi:hypothetical protein ACFY3U_06920 [Micromonospora sp. NPDC000089]|uniref:hypothetical protein n=1 Tax=unclassified Micromonospora TaxID=2617518 RepID=UPI0036AC5DDC
MTAREFGEVDHDLLADYVGGALDGTPEESTVARLVEAEPAWADAYAALAPAVARVTADLATWGEPAPEMPMAVRDRLTAALAGAGPATQPDHVAAVGQPDDGTAAGGRTVPAQGGGPARRTGGSRPTEQRPEPTGPGRGGRRWTRLAGPVALAAASLAAVGLGVGQLIDRAGDGAADRTAALPAGTAAADGAAVRFSGEPLRTGTDWTPETLAGGTPPPQIASGGPQLQPGDGPSGRPQQKRTAPGGLDRLTDRAALDACLTEVSAAHGRGPVSVELVDYAAFRGEPALVVRFVDPAGERWAWVSGAECGVPGSGPDTRYQARVG